jgi:peptide/nickel transport system substrate-binding protein
VSIKLKVNPDWWMKSPYIQNIEVLPFSDNATAIKSLVLRQLDAVQTDNLTVAQYRDSGDANVYEYPTHNFDYLAVNYSSEDLKDKGIRQAVAYAIDRREIAAWAYSNHAIVADTPVPPDSWLYDGKVLHYNKDVKKARELISSLGWVADADGNWMQDPGGVQRTLKMRILTNREESDTLRVDSARLIADQLKEVGIDAQVDIEDWDTYLTKLKDKDYDLALCGCYLSPVPDLGFLLRTDGALNTGGWGNDSMDEILDQIVEINDSKKLSLRMADLQSAIIEELPIISLYFRTHSLLTSPSLQGVSGVQEDSAYANLSQWYLP